MSTERYQANGVQNASRLLWVSSTDNKKLEKKKKS